MKNKHKLLVVLIWVLAGLLLLAAALWGLLKWLAKPILAAGKTASRGVKLNNPGNIHELAKPVFVGQVFPATDNVTGGGEKLAQFKSSVYGVAAIMKLIQSYISHNPSWTIKQVFSHYINGDHTAPIANSYVNGLPFLNQSSGWLSSYETMKMFTAALILSETGGVKYSDYVYRRAYQLKDKEVAK